MWTRSGPMSATTERTLRIGKVAERLGVTTRTIRYYEELGLLGGESDRCKGAHRLYGEADIAHLQQVLRMKDLLGLSLDQIVDLAQVEEARAASTDAPSAATSRLWQAACWRARSPPCFRRRRRASRGARAWCHECWT